MNTIASQRARLRAQEKFLTRKHAAIEAQESSNTPDEDARSSPDTASAQSPCRNSLSRAPSLHLSSVELLPCSSFCSSPYCRRGQCYYNLSPTDSIETNIHIRSAMRVRSVRKHNKRVTAYQKAQVYSQTEFGNWFSKLSQEVEVDDEDEEDREEGDVSNGTDVVLEFSEDFWRYENGEAIQSSEIPNSERTGPPPPKKD
jgi:hypothetical protein